VSGDLETWSSLVVPAKAGTHAGAGSIASVRYRADAEKSEHSTFLLRFFAGEMGPRFRGDDKE